ncbi:DUF6734 family protein [Flavobacterium hungaricum]|uniref:DUF6734 domain-containing protein n=1 Tax=Flavobacterium hungaricum TaxID=2082725 RepID=A0ABR9TSB3_9FLAO|nr:DUF6734 family protein [Flavobacterium hungaricum]MBE8728230.1 hypothetical protein [Flavobacterium hungaricum]
MKIIQSFWSGNATDFTHNYGWFSYKYNWLSWLLSCHQLVKFHKDVELYTDRFGYEILIKKLQLPYTKVHVILDDLNEYHKDLWAVSKIKVYEMQEEPFLHVDGDVFVWDSLTDKFKNAAVLTQNLEITAASYIKKWNEISPHLVYLPLEMENYHKNPNNFACNMGVAGGNDIQFFKEYAQKSIDFVDKNRSAFSKINCLSFNLFFEQILFYQFAAIKEVKVDFLFDQVYNDGEYFGFAEFHEVPQKSYLHLLGVYKRNPFVCKAMEVYIMKNYPESYSKIAALVNEAERNQNEVEFLTQEKVAALTADFDFELKTNKKSSDNYLLKRDLYTAGMPNYFQSLVAAKEDFKIVLLDGFKHIRTTRNEEEFSFLEIEDRNSVSRKYELDELDEEALSVIAAGTRYFDCITSLLEHFEYDSEEEENDILILLNKKLTNYIVYKIIAIYK